MSPPSSSPSRRNQLTPPIAVSSPIDGGGLLSALAGHVATGSNPPRADGAWIERHLGRVEEALRWTKATGRECGFLSYFAAGDGAELVPEETCRGTRNEIQWKWEHTDAAVAFTFHTHPGEASIAFPSGLDVLGATVRGDHVHYILDMHGRLVGWRFRDARDWPRATQRSLKALSDRHELDRAFVAFLTEALEALVPRMMEPCYGARLELMDDGVLLTRVEPHRLLAEMDL